MENLFRYDSKFWSVLGKITDIVILNLMCITFCLPIITAGASVTAAYSIGTKMVKKQEVYIVQEFIKNFKSNLKISTLVWIIMLAVGLILGFDIHISKLVLNKSVSIILQFIFTTFSIVFIFALIYVFPIISKFDNTIIKTITNSILISIDNLPYTIIIVMINLSPLLLTSIFNSCWGQILFFYTVIGFGINIYLNSILFNKIFEKYVKQ